MNNGLGDILYILVMIAALVFSIYKKAKSAEQGGSIMPEREVDDYPDEAFPSFDDWFDKKGTDRSKPVAEEVAQPMQPGKMQHKPLEYKKPDYQIIRKTDALKRPERITRITPRQVRKSLAKEDSNEQVSYWENEPLDLRDAIIYAEIIKRPTY